jgi:hypothetical protein
MARARRPGRNGATLPLLPSIVGPPEIRLLNRTAMKGSWADPDDENPNRRVARQVGGFRAFCPLRRLLGGAVAVVEEHVIAADRLRQLADVARLGYLGARDLGMPVNVNVYGPLTGPSQAQLARSQCQREFRRAMSLFDADQATIVDGVILGGQTLTAWRQEQHIGSERAGRLLVEVLDMLVQHFADDVRRAGVLAA